MNSLQTPSALVFAYFTGNGEDGLHLAYSQDGLTFATLKGGQAVFNPRKGSQQLMRDPFLMQGADGYFHALWTTGWKGNDIGYARSLDFLNWEDARALPVMVNEAKTQNCWAPEMVYDSETAQYLLFWSSTVLGQHEDRHRIYCCTTPNFQTFSSARLFYDPGYVVIDATIVKNEHDFLMFIKHEQGGLIEGQEGDSNAPGGEKAIHLAKSKQLLGPYTLTGSAIVGESVGSYEDAAEGPTVLRLGNSWYLYFDYYRRNQYGLMTSNDLLSWQNRSADLCMPEGARHGSMLYVSDAILENLLAT